MYHGVSSQSNLRGTMTNELMNRDEWNILHYVEEHWLRKGEFPALSKIAKDMVLDQVKVVEALSSPLLQKSLDARGIPWMEVDDRLTPIQVATINLILNVSDKRSTPVKLKSLGVNPSTYKGWRRQKQFMLVMREQGERLFGETMPEVHKALMDKALEGDPTSLKLYYAMAGRWDDKKSVESMNIRFVMVKLLEVIQTHVRDPEALQAIAADFEALLGNEQRAIS